MATPQLSPGVLVRELDLTVGRADNVTDNIGEELLFKRASTMTTHFLARARIEDRVAERPGSQTRCRIDHCEALLQWRLAQKER